MSLPESSAQEERVVASQFDDARGGLLYLVVPEAGQYIAIMDVLEAAVGDLTPHELGERLRAAGGALDQDVLELRLDKLRAWGAVSARTDASRILRHADLLARNWRYTATPTGRQVQRFYRKVLAASAGMREIPLSSLARVVEAAEGLAHPRQDTLPPSELTGRLFVNHDHLDAALVGAEDSLASLADRFDLNDASTHELKTLLVRYATHVAAELERGAARAHRALQTLRPRFVELAQATVHASDARMLIERGTLSASRGGRLEDWEALLAWFDPGFGRAVRFALRLVRALPGMHVNLRRLHSSSGAAISRARALTLAKACAHPVYGTAVLLAALGDHPWRKLHGCADDAELTHLRSWRAGPRVEVPELLRSVGRAGARGRAPAARDDGAAREAVRRAREQRAAQHVEAIREVLASHGAPLSDRAARVALAALSAAARTSSDPAGRRTGVGEGLACTLFPSAETAGCLVAPTWRVVTPGHVAIFHLPGAAAQPPRAAAHEPQVAACAPSCEAAIEAPTGVRERPAGLGDAARDLKCAEARGPAVETGEHDVAARVRARGK